MKDEICDLPVKVFQRLKPKTQQTFVLMKTYWRHPKEAFCLRLQKASSRCLDQDENIHLTHTCSEELFKTSSRRLNEDQIIVLVIRLQDVFKRFSRRLKTSSRFLAKASSNRLQDVFKTSCRKVFKTSSTRLQDVLKTPSRRFKDIFKISSRLIQDVFKTSSRRLQGVLQRFLEDVFKTYHQGKLFLLTRFQNDFEKYSKRFWDVLQTRLSTEGFA